MENSNNIPKFFNQFMENQIENALKNIDIQYIKSLDLKTDELKEVYFKDIYDITFTAFFDSTLNGNRQLIVGYLSYRIDGDTAYFIKIRMEDGFDKEEFAKLLYRKARIYFKTNNIINIKNIEEFSII